MRKLMTCLALFLCSASVQAKSSHAVFIEQNFRGKVGIFYSTDEAVTWKPAKIDRYIFPAPPRLSDVTCTTNKTCVAVGAINTSGGPLIFTSHNNGESWSNKKMPSMEGELLTVSCQDKFCVSGGTTAYYKNTVLLQSQDSGNSWKLVKPTVEGASLTGLFINSTCNKNLCIVAGRGTYAANNNLSPLLLSTNDKGKNWRSVDVAIPDIESNDFFYVHGMRCTDNACYVLMSHTGLKKFFLLVGNKDGSQWKYVAPKLSDDTALSDVTYANNAIVLAGRDKNGPIVLRSTDEGTTWTNANIDYIGKALITNLTNVNCEQSLCRAVGQSYKNGMQRPQYLKSADGGLNWDINPTIANLPADFSAYHDSLACNDNICVSLYEEFMLISHDAGISWQYQDQKLVLGNNWLKAMTFSLS